MNLQEVFEQLSVGEFSQMSIGSQEAGEINETNWNRVIPHINLGLTAIYTRFNLKEGRLLLDLLPDRSTYPLHSDYAVSNLRSQMLERYILDTEDAPFEDDLLKVEKVITEPGARLALNDGANPWSVLTPNMKTVVIPKAILEKNPDLPDDLKTDKLEIIYRANHRKIIIPLGYFNPEREELEIPESHLAALLYFVASRVHNPIGMVNEFHAGNSYAAKYEMECQRLENAGLAIDVGESNTRFESGGWV